jgi:hypothetical protein
MAAHASIEMKGLTELREALLKLPEDLTQESAVIVMAHAEAAKQEMAAKYPIGPKRKGHTPGALIRGLTIDRRVAVYTASAILRNRAPHAYIYEHGSEMRYTDTGVERGKMPPGRVFIPIAVRHRQIMTYALIDLVRRAGFTVSEAQVA